MPLSTRYWFLDTGYWILKGSFPYIIQDQASRISSIVTHRLLYTFFNLSSGPPSSQAYPACDRNDGRQVRRTGLSWLGTYFEKRSTKLFEQQSENKEKNSNKPERYSIWEGALAFLYCKDCSKCYGALMVKRLFENDRENVK